MTVDKVKCPLCSECLLPTYIDIGDDNEPTFILGLTCDCSGWLELEMNKSGQMDQLYGEIDE